MTSVKVSHVEEKFRVNRKMRGKIMVYDSIFERILNKIVLKMQNWALQKFQILVLKSKFDS